MNKYTYQIQAFSKAIRILMLPDNADLEEAISKSYSECYSALIQLEGINVDEDIQTLIDEFHRFIDYYELLEIDADKGIINIKANQLSDNQKYEYKNYIFNLYDRFLYYHYKDYLVGSSG